MKIDKLVGERFKEKPSDCVIDSHALMLRGGYMKNVANGIYSSFMPLRRITRKIENIIREEMDAIGGQEVQFPVVMPASLWNESGRYEAIGSELLRFTDRNDIPMVLGMTHEEAAVQLVREYANSYNKYPFMIYQIQTKFRDEARPRGGLIRVREFTMKDAYSFHTSQEDLERYYDICYKAYERIFARAGIPETITVKSDSGMMGGKVAHEYQLLTDAGEDRVIVCDHCQTYANAEVATAAYPAEREDLLPLTEIATPGAKTIEDLTRFTGAPATKMAKMVFYTTEKGQTVAVIIRGDLEVN
ncbi:MAG: proline--tRNA ligase, partial [Oscillospiraceae bacterium]|nr:proline--tRNA ligase [Oscillospiraceae bacterium]